MNRGEELFTFSHNEQKETTQRVQFFLFFSNRNRAEESYWNSSVLSGKKKTFEESKTSKLAEIKMICNDHSHNRHKYQST